MTILGIDPGSQESGWCVWDGLRVVDFGIATNPALLGTIDNYANDAVAVEHLQCFGQAVGASTFETAYWIGEFRAQCRGRREFLKVMRTEVKLHFCNSVRAKDPNVRQALIDRFGDKGTKKNPGITYGFSKHIWSAFAIAVYAMDKRTTRTLHELNREGKL